MAERGVTTGERFAMGLADALGLGIEAEAVVSALRLALGDDLGASSLTGRGVPFEASVTGSGEVDAALRWVVESASGMPFFRPRLAEQQRIACALADRLPPPGRDVALAAIDAFVADLAPDPAAVPARSRRGLYVGAVQRNGELDALKIYGLVQETTVLAQCEALASCGALAPSMVGIEVAADGTVARKLYLRTTRPLDRGEVARLVESIAPGSAHVLDLLDDVGLARWWRRRLFLSCGDSVSPSLHGPAGRDRAALRRLARHCHGGEEGIDALVAAGEASGAPWSFTMVALGLGAPDPTPKLNVYAAPDTMA